MQKATEGWQAACPGSTLLPALELHRQDRIFKNTCVSTRVVGSSYNLEGCWLRGWVQPESFTLLQETEGSLGKGAKPPQ